MKIDCLVAEAEQRLGRAHHFRIGIASGDVIDLGEENDVIGPGDDLGGERRRE
jgi:hypothetical protein